MRALAIFAGLFALVVLAPLANQPGEQLVAAGVTPAVTPHVTGNRGNSVRTAQPSGARSLAIRRTLRRPKRETGYGLIRFNGRGPEAWNRAFRYERLKVHALKRKLRHLRRSSRARGTSVWHTARVSWYPTDGTSGGCGMADGPSTFAGPAPGWSNVSTPYVPCGAHVEFCLNGRCVYGTRTDSGPAPWTGNDFDLSTEMASALGYYSAGIAYARWRLAR